MLKKILIVEDEKQLLNNISILLKAENFDVVTAANGKEGIYLAVKEKPDLIICDIMMPGMDGYDVLEELGKNCTTSLIPFIFLTAKVETGDLRKGMELGADDYLFKPFKSEELIKAITTRLNKFEIVKATILNEEKKNTDGQKVTRYKLEDNIFFRLPNSSVIVAVGKIKYIAADNQYTCVVHEDNKLILIRRSISKWEEILPEKLFIRIHRSTIINTLYINKIEKSPANSYKVILKDTSKKLDISRKYLRKIKKINH
ncbi:MAG: response regulator [Ignavibacteria bacterium]|nr:response regulator [Ignavibacteria bacterium]